MTPDNDETLLASFDEQSEAELAQTVLEGEEIPCRVGELAQVPNVLGELGVLGRRTGIWVSAADLERASAALADAESGVDPSALAAEAVAAGGAESAGAQGGEPGGSRYSPTVQGLAWIFLAVIGVGLGFLALRFLLAR